jgi:hypothetical protein
VRVKTIIYDVAGTGFYISARRWNDANYAFRNRSNCKNLDDWRWIGSRGWFCTEENKLLFEAIASQMDLDNWHYGEFEEVDITL